MRVMMLHVEHRQRLRFVERPLRAQVLGVLVARHHLGRKLEQPLVDALRLEPRVERLGVLHVADVLRDERFARARQAERGLLLGTGGEHRPDGVLVVGSLLVVGDGTLVGGGALVAGTALIAGGVLAGSSVLASGSLLVGSGLLVGGTLVAGAALAAGGLCGRRFGRGVRARSPP